MLSPSIARQISALSPVLLRSATTSSSSSVASVLRSTSPLLQRAAGGVAISKCFISSSSTSPTSFPRVTVTPPSSPIMNPKVISIPPLTKRTMLNSDYCFDGFMTAKILKEVIREQIPGLQKVGQHWEGNVEGGKFRFYCFIDETSDRVHMMIPIERIEKVKRSYLLRLLSANFNSALDSKYAFHEDIVWSVFLHPLHCLTPEFAVNAIAQVITLAKTTGTSFSSSNLRFMATTAPSPDSFFADLSETKSTVSEAASEETPSTADQ
jgi:hypothetical protein